jgi:hypothetical protein
MGKMFQYHAQNATRFVGLDSVVSTSIRSEPS